MDQIEYSDDTKQEVGLLIFRRLPWLIIGLLGAIFASLVVSRFEEILTEKISLAFFLPLIVYISGAMGTQTQTIFVRNLARPGKDRFSIYIIKEFLLGLFIGITLGLVVGASAWIWLKDPEIAAVTALAIFINLTIAPLVALFTSEVLYKRHTDPALGAGPIATIIQDVISIVVYFLVAYIILF